MTEEESASLKEKASGGNVERYEKMLADLISTSAPMQTIQMAYAELIYMRMGANKVHTAAKLEIDRRTLHRWFAISPNKEELRSGRTQSFYAFMDGKSVRIIGRDPKSVLNVIVQAENGDLRSVEESLIDRRTDES